MYGPSGVADASVTSACESRPVFRRRMHHHTPSPMAATTATTMRMITPALRRVPIA
jgi:hypothetical protein